MKRSNTQIMNFNDCKQNQNPNHMGTLGGNRNHRGDERGKRGEKGTPTSTSTAGLAFAERHRSLRRSSTRGRRRRMGAAEDTGSEPTRLRDKARGSEIFLRAPAMLVS